MSTLYPPSADRANPNLERMLEELTHDRARTDPNSRHFHLMNSVFSEVETALARTTMFDPRPWRADVRQGAVVRKAPEGLPEKDLNELLYGPPDQIWLYKLRRYEEPNYLVSEDDELVDKQSVVAVEHDGKLWLQGEGTIFALEADKKITSQTQATADLIIRHEPGQAYTSLNRGRGHTGSVNVQVEGLDVVFAGRGTFDLTIRYTGIVPAASTIDISGIEHLEEPLNLSDADEEHLYGYTRNGDIITPDTYPKEYSSLDQAPDDEIMNWDDPEDNGFLYYEAIIEETVRTRSSSPLHVTPEHRYDLSDHAERMLELPDADYITAIQTVDVLALVRVSGTTIEITKDGYVGHTNTGHNIHHILPGRHHVMACGDGRLSIVEPTSGHVHTYNIPRETVGLTWTDEGLIGLVVYVGDAYEVYALDEIRQGQQAGYEVAPPVDTNPTE